LSERRRLTQLLGHPPARRGTGHPEVKEIESAIGRAERGTYGMCERCGRPIAEERLRVAPSASLCINCAKLQFHSAQGWAPLHDRG
jgi:RNA polymerase-binding transcription factor DksA